MTKETELVEAASNASGEVSTKKGGTRHRCSRAFKTTLQKELTREGNESPYTHKKEEPRR